MKPKEKLVLAAVVTVFIIVTAGTAWLFSGGQGALPTDKRFTAKSGTTREKAVALTSKKRKKAVSSRPAEGESDDPQVKVRSLSPYQEGEGTETDKALRGAMNSLSPETGVQKLNEELKKIHTPEEQAQLHAAMGQLYAQFDPPNYPRAHAAFARARAAAPNTPARQAVVFHESNVLLQQGLRDQARGNIEEALAEEGSVSAASLKLGILLGRLYEEDQGPEHAEDSHIQTFRGALDVAETLDKEARDLVRLTGLELARLYRQDGRPGQAQELAGEMNEQLMAPKP